MYVSRFLPLLVLMVTLAGAGWMYAQQTQTAGVLSPQDIHEIEQVVQGYTRGIDIGPEDSSWVFTSDAVFEYSAGSVTGATVHGADELKEFYAGLRKTNTTRHVLSNLVITPSPGGATSSVYMTSIDRTDSAPVAVTAFGMYEDTFVKTSEGWRIKRRVYTQHMPPLQVQR